VKAPYCYGGVDDKFLDKLADCLEGHQVSDTSELNEGEWGIDVE
jgi:hypothetical protein